MQCLIWGTGRIWRLFVIHWDKKKMFGLQFLKLILLSFVNSFAFDFFLLSLVISSFGIVILILYFAYVDQPIDDTIGGVSKY